MASARRGEGLGDREEGWGVWGGWRRWEGAMGGGGGWEGKGWLDFLGWGLWARGARWAVEVY